MRRTTEVLEKAAGDAGDEFLQYLYGVAILHLEESAGIRSLEVSGSFTGDVDPIVTAMVSALLAKQNS